MAENLLARFRKMNRMLAESSGGLMHFNQLCVALSDALEANVYVSDADGLALGKNLEYVFEVKPISLYDTEIEDKYSDEVAARLKMLREPIVNMTYEQLSGLFNDDYDAFDRVHSIFPIEQSGKMLGTLLVTRSEPEFSEEDTVLCEYGAVIVGLEISRINAIKEKEAERERQAVEVAINNLSYSEVDAAINIFEELKGEEGLLVASKIADRSGITRSVIVNALRKLESAGIIETKSLGMKGTFIRIVNGRFKEALASVRR